MDNGWRMKSFEIPTRAMTFIRRSYDGLGKTGQGIEIVRNGKFEYSAVGAMVLFASADFNRQLLLPVSLEDIRRCYWEDMTVYADELGDSEDKLLEALSFEDWDPSEDAFKALVDETFDQLCGCWNIHLRGQPRVQRFEAINIHNADCDAYQTDACNLMRHKPDECFYTDWHHSKLKADAF